MNLTHLDENNQPKMVDVSNKENTTRIAIASGLISMSQKAFDNIISNNNKKGPVIQTAVISAIMGTKRTSELIPMCHPVLVSGINMICTLLIIILENNTLIAVLKTLGATNHSIRKMFLYMSARIIGIGLLAGNLLGIGLCLLQKHSHFIKLPEESYYISYVPVKISVWDILLINVGTFSVCLLILIVPSYIISRMTIATSLRFD